MKKVISRFFAIVLLLAFSRSVFSQETPSLDSIENEIKLFSIEDSDSLSYIALLLDFHSALLKSKKYSELKTKSLTPFITHQNIALLHEQTREQIAFVTPYLKGTKENLEILRLLLDYSLEKKQPDLKIKSLQSIGHILYLNEQYSTAVDFYLQATMSLNNENNSFEKAEIQMNLGSAYIHTKEFEKAEKHLNQSLEFFSEEADIEHQAVVYSQLGLLFLAQNKFDEAIKYLNQSIDFSRAIGDVSLIATNQEYLGNLFQAAEEWDESYNYYLKADSIYRAENNLKQASITTLKLGEISFALNKFTESRQLAGNAISLGNSNGNLNVVFQSQVLLSKLAYKSNEYEAAYHYLKLSQIINEGITKEKKELENYVKSIFTLRGLSNSDSNSIDLMSNELKNEKKRKNTIQFLVIFFFISAIVLLILLFYMRKNNVNLHHLLMDTNAQLSSLNKKTDQTQAASRNAIIHRSEFLEHLAHTFIASFERYTHSTSSEDKANLAAKIEEQLNLIETVSQSELDIISFNYRAVDKKELLSFLKGYEKKQTNFSLRAYEFPNMVFTDPNVLRGIFTNTFSALNTILPSMTFSSTIIQKTSALNGMFYKIEFELNAVSDSSMNKKIERWFNHLNEDVHEKFEYHSEIPVEFLLANRLRKYLNAQIELITDAESLTVTWVFEFNGKEGQTANEFLKLNSVDEKSNALEKHAIYIHQMRPSEAEFIRSIIKPPYNFVSSISEAEIIIAPVEKIPLDTLSQKMKFVLIGKPNYDRKRAADKNKYYIPKDFTIQELTTALAK